MRGEKLWPKRKLNSQDVLSGKGFDAKKDAMQKPQIHHSTMWPHSGEMHLSRAPPLLT